MPRSIIYRIRRVHPFDELVDSRRARDRVYHSIPGQNTNNLLLTKVKKYSICLIPRRNISKLQGDVGFGQLC